MYNIKFENIKRISSEKLSNDLFKDKVFFDKISYITDNDVILFDKNSISPSLLEI